MTVQGLKQIQINNIQTFLSIIKDLKRQRKTSSTKKNSTSSRSHLIVNIQLILTPPPPSSNVKRKKHQKRTLTIVDLAGSERHDDSTNHTPKLMKESSSINQTHLSLKKVIKAISRQQQHQNTSNSNKSKQYLLHVFRGSKLTMALRNLFLHPKVNIHVLCTVSPSASCAHHSLDTLKNVSQLQLKQNNIDLSIFENLYTQEARVAPPPQQLPLSQPPPPQQQPPPPTHPTPPKSPPQSSSQTSDPSPRQKKNLVSLKQKLKLKLTGLTEENAFTNDNIINNNRPTHSNWKGLSPTARNAVAASANRRLSKTNPWTTTTIINNNGFRTEQIKTPSTNTTPLLRSHGSMIEMMKTSPCLVAVRVRPLSNLEISRGEKIALRVTSKSTLSLDLPPNNSKEQQSRIFSFDSCVHKTATQKETYMNTGHILLNKVLNGINACIFCYGATGAGKTHTLIGSSKNDRGILLEFTNELFQKFTLLKTMRKTKVQITITEIYREKLRDLLKPSNNPTIIGSNNCVKMKNVHYEEIHNLYDMERVLWSGLKNRVTGSTDANKRSSRSHAVIHMHVEQMEENGSMLKSKMIFVDLAGSERQERSGAAGKRLKEAASINKSLSALGNVILALVQSSHHIPFRSSILT
jgi:hypothetical protein